MCNMVLSLLSFKTLSILTIFSCYCSTGRAMEISEAEQIALESSGELLPPKPLVERVEKDLQAIRSQFSVVADVKHTPKWQPGKLLINSATKATIDKIKNSSYGPAEAQAIFQDIIYVVTFTKPYNPEKLAELLQKELGVTDASPDGVIGGSSSITLTCGEDKVLNEYVFFIGSGDCPSGCINKRYLTFTVGPDAKSAKLVKDTGDNPDQADQPVGVGLF